MPVVEIFQDYRGSAEGPSCPGRSVFPEVDGAEHHVQAALARGLRLGFIAGGDHGGVAQAGLFVRRLDRAGVLEALCARRVFGTTGIHCWLTFAVNGRVLGGEVTDAGSGTVEVELGCAAPEPVADAVLVINGREEAIPVAPGRRAWRWGGAVRVPSTVARPGYVYPRIRFCNGEIAWGSPVWVAAAGGGQSG